MHYNRRTSALLAAGVISLAAIAHAEEKATPATPSVLTALSATTLSGFVDTSVHWNFGTGNANLPPYTANGALGGTKADGFNLDLVALTLTKPAESGDWSAGYNATLLFGPDAVGYNNSVGSAAGDFSLKDAYVDLHAPIGNGLDIKLGTYTEILGYEVYETGNNPNYTRSYGYALEPTAMTGLLATYQFSPVVTAMVGICDAWSAGVNARSFPPQGTKAESFKTYMGMLMFTAPTNMAFLAGSTLNAGVISGYDAVFPVPGGANVTSYYVGGTVNTPVTGLKVGFAFDALDVAGLRGENWAAGGYVSFQATEKLTFNARGEYLKDRGAQKLFVNSSGAPTVPDEAMAVTLTAQYDLWKNVMSRLELRWDHALNDQGVWGGTAANGSGGPGTGNKDNAVVLAANIIYKF